MRVMSLLLTSLKGLAFPLLFIEETLGFCHVWCLLNTVDQCFKLDPPATVLDCSPESVPPLLSSSSSNSLKHHTCIISTLGSCLLYQFTNILQLFNTFHFPLNVFPCCFRLWIYMNQQAWTWSTVYNPAFGFLIFFTATVLMQLPWQLYVHQKWYLLLLPPSPPSLILQQLQITVNLLYYYY